MIIWNNLGQLQLLLLIVFQSTLVSAQFGSSNQNTSTDLPTIISPAPTVAAMMRFEEVPVNAYSGQPDISIPLLSIPISDNMNYNLALSYNTQGVRIDERSGWTGRGWTLINGGVISRTVKGLPDETNYLPAGRGVYHNGFENFSSLPITHKEEFLWKTANGDERYDSDYDLYQYNILGRTGRFIVEKDSNTLIPVILESENKDIIHVFYNTTTYEITNFEVIDTAGYVFLFDVGNVNFITSHTSTTPHYGSSSTGSSDNTGAQNVPNAWYLTKIKSPNGIVLCSFSYQSVSESYNTPTSRISSKIIGNVAFGDNDVKNINKSMLMPKVIATNQTIFSTQKYVNTVTFRDSTKVKFLLSPGNPELGCLDNNNCSNGAKLDYIEAYSSNNTLFKKYKFIYHTTTNNRLFLDQIQDIGGSQSLSYDFEYKNRQFLPEFNSFKKDQWGYYNGDNNVRSNSRFMTHAYQVNENTINTGVISSIKYPTGGKKIFNFESNKFSYQGDQLYDVQKIPDNRIFKNRYGDFTASNNNNGESNLKLLLYIDKSQVISVENVVLSHGDEINPEDVKLKLSKVQPKPGINITLPSNGIINYSQYDIDDFERDGSGWAYSYDVSESLVTNVSAGWYYIELKVSPIRFTPTGDDLINVHVDIYYTFFSLISRAMVGGGVRIKDITFEDENAVRTKTSYNYDDPDPLLVLSSGSFEFYPESRTYTKWKTHPFLDGISCTAYQQLNHRNPKDVRYEVTRDINEVLTPNTKGSYVGYKYVTISRDVEIGIGEIGNGKERLEFVSPREVQINNAITLNYPFPSPESKDYKRGVMREKIIFDGNNRELIKEEYNYRDIFNIRASSYIMFETQNYDCPWDNFYNSFDTYSDYQNYSIDNPLGTCHPFGVIETHSSNMTCYQNNSDMRFISYNHTSGVSLLEETIKTNYFYDDQFNQTSVTTREEITYNDINFLIATKKDFIVEGEIEKEYKKEYFYSVGYLPLTYNQTILTKLRNQNRINELLVTQTYKDNILLSQSVNEFLEFGTNQILPNQIKLSKGNNVTEKRLEFHRYDQYNNLLEVSKPKSPHISYIWGYEHRYPVAKIEGVTFAEIESLFGTNFHAGHGALTTQQISDLKIAFPNAMISTFSYNPLIGMTTMTDAKGYSSYYEYDYFNRLKFVKDAQHRILSKNDYNYKN